MARQTCARDILLAGTYLLEQTAIYPLAAQCADIVMWPHYGDEHKGVCMGFDTRYWPFNFGVAFATTGTRSQCSGNIDNILCGMAYRRKSSSQSQLLLLVSVVLYIVVVEVLTYAPYWFHAMTVPGWG
jgi:hypothetical protein